MKQFKHSFVVDAPIDQVWKFYTNINHLKIITPAKMGIEIYGSHDDVFQEGSEFWIGAKMIMKSRWHSKITACKPYEYVDEMISGNFKRWRHVHKFNRVQDDKTEVVDQIDFQLPLGLIGMIFEDYALGRLQKIFEYREKSTIDYFQSGL